MINITEIKYKLKTLEELALYIAVASRVALAIYQQEMQAGVFTIEESQYLYDELLWDFIEYCFDIEETEQQQSED